MLSIQMDGNNWKISDVNKIITFGSIKDKYDILISSNNSNQVVRTLKNYTNLTSLKSRNLLAK